MSHCLPHHLKRLQHDINSNPHLSKHNHQSHNSHTNSSDYRSRLPNDEAIRESIQHFSISANNNTKPSQSFKPGPLRARRGGGRSRDRHWHSSLPKRAINYDLAESFMDHSTNPLSSDLYKIKFKHSAKQWPNGRFRMYKEKLDKLDGNIIEITCIRTFPVVSKRKKIPETNQNEQNVQQNVTITTTATTSSSTTTTSSLLLLLDPVIQEDKKLQVVKQTSSYPNLFGGGRIPRLSSTTQSKKPNSAVTSTSSAAISLLGENSTEPQT